MRRPVAHVVLTALLLPGLVLAGAPLGVPTPNDSPATARPLAKPIDAPAPAGPTAADLETLAKRYPQIDFDPAAKAAALPDGVEPAFQFVRDSIRFESYAGVLRGAGGACAARAANAADRSMLLAALLTAKKIPVRYAIGTLSSDAAAVLADRVFAAPAVAALAAAKSADLSPFAARVRARADRDFSNVHRALGDRMPRASLTRDDLIAEVRPHVWLQARVSDAWVDLDSSFADAVSGKRYCEPEQTADALPAAAYQRVTLRLTIERLDGGKLTTSTALEQTAPAADWADRQLFIIHQPASGMKGLGAAVSGAGADAFVPVLWIDGKTTAGTPVDFTGTGGKADEKPKGAIRDAMGALSATPDEPAAPPAAAQFVAEYLDLEIARPGGAAPIKHRRVLIDRVGAAWHAGGAFDASQLRPLPHDAQGVVAPRAIHNLQISTGGHDLWSYTCALQSLAIGDGPTAETTDFAEQAWPMAIQNLAVMIWADNVLLPAMNQDSAARFYCDAPRLVLFSLTPETGKADARLRTQIDLMHDTVRGVARDAATAPDAARGKLWYGVAEGALEHEFTAEQAAAAGVSAEIVSTSALADGGALVVIDSNHPAAAATGDTAARVKTALARGDTLVAPESALRAGESGWWAVSPRGDTRAVVGDDFGDSSAVLGSPGSSGRAGVNNVNPNTGSGVGRGGGAGGGPRAPKAGNMQSKGRSASEYLTIVMEVSVPSWVSFSVLTYTVAVTVFQVTKELYR